MFYLELKEKLAGLRESYAALLEGDGDDAKAFRKAMERFDSTAERMSRKIDVFELLKNDPQGQQIEHTALFVANEAKRSYDVAPEVIYELLVQIEKTTDLLSKETADEAPMGEIALEPLNKAHLMAKRFLHEALKILFYRYYRASADRYADLRKVASPNHLNPPPLFLTPTSFQVLDWIKKHNDTHQVARDVFRTLLEVVYYFVVLHTPLPSNKHGVSTHVVTGCKWGWQLFVPSCCSM